ncbi:hypothetical protein HY468_03255 [Candidatus Roizmanbacteria bacterium]|nr:hypothetical protein [Candidatus Roizmanbacteria bacterium]
MDAQSPSALAYAPNQLVVQYKEGVSPDELYERVSVRWKERKKFLIGTMKLFWSDLQTRVTGSTTPESQLLQLIEFDHRIGVKAKERLFPSDETAEPPFFLLYLDGTMTIPQAITLYQNLPLVTFVEPNNLYTGSGR